MKHLRGYPVFINEKGDDKELMDLLKDMQGLGLTLTDEEKDMLDFVNQFGGGMSAEDYAETLYDYFTNPEEYEIDKEGDYYDMIWYLFENSVEDHARCPSAMVAYHRWDTSSIEQEPLYKLYIKMSNYYNKRK